MGLVRDDTTGLVWTRYPTGMGTDFCGVPYGVSQTSAKYCAGIGMRLPTETEALGVAADADPCAWPVAWSMWTSTLAGPGRRGTSAPPARPRATSGDTDPAFNAIRVWGTCSPPGVVRLRRRGRRVHGGQRVLHARLPGRDVRVQRRRRPVPVRRRLLHHHVRHGRGRVRVRGAGRRVRGDERLLPRDLPGRDVRVLAARRRLLDRHPLLLGHLRRRRVLLLRRGAALHVGRDLLLGHVRRRHLRLRVPPPPPACPAGTPPTAAPAPARTVPASARRRVRPASRTRCAARGTCTGGACAP